MKLLGCVVLFIVLLGSALAENKIDFHPSDFHSHEKHSEKSDCDHYHVHCSNLCIGLLVPNKQILPVPFTYLAELQFNQPLLIVRDFSTSLYRPPIS